MVFVWTNVYQIHLPKLPITEMSSYRNVRLPKCPHTEMSVYRNVCLPKCPLTEKSIYRNVRIPKCPFTEMSVYRNVRLPKCPFTEMSVYRNVRYRNVCILCVAGGGYKGHVETLAPAVQELADLEKRAQSSYISLLYGKPFVHHWKRPVVDYESHSA